MREDILLSMNDFGCLLLNRGNHTRMRMSGIGDRNTGGEIHVPLTIHVPDVDALAVIDKDRRIAANHLGNKLLWIEGDVLSNHDRSFRMTQFKCTEQGDY